MKKAIIIYNSKTGNTKHFAGEICKQLKNQNIDAESISIFDYSPENITNSDIVFLGCWTSGWMIIFQHPQKVWKEFAAKLPDLSDKKVALFTTYKVATGSMFNNMKKHISHINMTDIPIIKSKSGELTDAIKAIINKF
ncbi:MAG: flavodoxin family protein [bacterium]